MKLRAWIFAGLGISLAAYIVVSRRTAETDGLESAGDRIASWGRKRQIVGASKYAVGGLKKWFGRVLGKPHLVGDGVGDQVAGAAQHTVGKAASSVGEVIHDLKR